MLLTINLCTIKVKRYPEQIQIILNGIQQMIDQYIFTMKINILENEKNLVILNYKIILCYIGFIKISLLLIYNLSKN